MLVLINIIIKHHAGYCQYLLITRQVLGFHECFTANRSRIGSFFNFCSRSAIL